jgi:hypothetical protein
MGKEKKFFLNKKIRGGEGRGGGTRGEGVVATMSAAISKRDNNSQDHD